MPQDSDVVSGKSPSTRSITHKTKSVRLVSFLLISFISLFFKNQSIESARKTSFRRTKTDLSTVEDIRSIQK